MEYPAGAVQTIEEALKLQIGQDAYIVHGLGRQSFLSHYKIIKPEFHSLSFPQRWAIFFKARYADEKKLTTSFSLGDCNIGAHHNHHFLFLELELAEAYLAHAKVNTSDMRSDDYV